MPILFKIDPTIKLIYFAGYGVCTGHEFITAKEETEQDQNYHTQLNAILDIRKADLDISLEEIRTGIRILEQFPKNGVELQKTALISNNPYTQHLINAIELMSGEIPVQMKSFSSESEAAAWLGTPGMTTQIKQLGDALWQAYQMETQHT